MYPTIVFGSPLYSSKKAILSVLHFQFHRIHPQSVPIFSFNLYCLFDVLVDSNSIFVGTCPVLGFHLLQDSFFLLQHVRYPPGEGELLVDFTFHCIKGKRHWVGCFQIFHRHPVHRSILPFDEYLPSAGCQLLPLYAI